MIETAEGSVPPSDKLEEVRNDLAEMYKNEQLMGVAKSDETVCRLLERNITKVNRLLSGLGAEKKIMFGFDDEAENSYSGPELAKKFKVKKRGIKRIVPKLESDYDMDDTVPYLKLHVGTGYISTVHTDSSSELEMGIEEARACSWDAYKKDLDELYEDMLRAIMLLEPKSFPWRDNVISEKMTTERILEMVTNAKKG